MTQQRLGFDIDWAGRYLTTGDRVRVTRLMGIMLADNVLCLEWQFESV